MQTLENNPGFQNMTPTETDVICFVVNACNFEQVPYAENDSVPYFSVDLVLRALERCTPHLSNNYHVVATDLMTRLREST